ncbi:G2/mitotic-specific cyclin-A isoform X2 [Periplaneta americana]|uniref:G2/mitotic-specific cyclin-A isoform X2 n=1 Tax=Periplaneta americana TaxID=6978 RepID=UPI0037E8D504
MATFRIHQDQENNGSDFKHAQGDPPQQQKRTVLGELNKNTNRIFSQRQKQESTVQDENIGAKQKYCVSQAVQKVPFKIHEDKLAKEKTVVLRDSKPHTSDAASSKTRQLDLPASITNLHRPPLQDIKLQEKPDIYEDDSAGCSPMSLDKSIVSTPPREKTKTAQDLLLDVDEYREEIYQYLREAETRHRPKPGYMRKQPDITYSMRSILVDWLVEVAEEYKLQTETLYLAVSYIDRFLSFMSVVRAKLQLVGTAAMFIAAKYEEIYPPDVGEFVYITDDTYTKKQVLRMEHLILKVLAFDLSVPTILSFITNFAVSTDLPDTTMFLAMYLSELSLLEADPYLQFVPSEMAAASIALAQHTLDQEVWSQELEDATGYKIEDLKQCIHHLNLTYSNATTYPQQAIREKYKGNRWHNVSLLTPRTPPLC